MAKKKKVKKATFVQRPVVDDNESENSDVVGSLDASSAVTSNVERATPQKECGSSSGLCTGAAICPACMDPITDGDETTMYRRVCLHSEPCMNGVRTYNRVIKDDPVERVAELDEFEHYPQKWHLRVKPFCHVGTRKAEIQKLKIELKRKRSYEDEQVVDDEKECSRSQYIAHMRELDKTKSPEQYGEEFDHKHKKYPLKDERTQSYAVVWAACPRVRRKVTGEAKERITDTRHGQSVVPISEGELVQPRGLVAGTLSVPSTASEIRPNDSVSQVSSKASSSGSKTVAKGSLADLFQKQMSGVETEPSPKTEKKHQKLEMKKQERARLLSLIESDVSLNTTQGMEIKEHLEEMYEEALALDKDNKSESLVKTLKTSLGSSMPKNDCDELIVQLKDKKSELQRERDRIESASDGKSSLRDLKGKCDTLVGAFATLLKTISDRVDGLKHKQSRMRKAERDKKNKVHYQKGKVVNALKSGGYPKSFASVFGGDVFTFLSCSEGGKLPDVMNVAKNEKQLGQEPCLFSGDSPIVKHMKDNILDNELTAKQKNKVDKKMKLETELLGANAKLDVPVTDLDDLDLVQDLTYLDKDGGCPWVSSTVHHKWRDSVCSVPLTGHAMLLAPLDCNQASLWIHLFPVQPLLKKGITIPDVKTFLASDKGKAFYESNVKLVRLKVGDVLGIPSGWVGTPIFLEESYFVEDEGDGDGAESTVSKQSSKSKAKASSAGKGLTSLLKRRAWSYYVTVPLLSVTEAMQVDTSAWNAMESLQTEFLAQMSGDAIYHARKTLMTKVYEEVKNKRG